MWDCEGNKVYKRMKYFLSRGKKKKKKSGVWKGFAEKVLFEQMSLGYMGQIMQTSREKAAQPSLHPKPIQKSPRRTSRTAHLHMQGKLKEQGKPRRRQRVDHVPEKGLKPLDRKRWACRANLGMRSLC